jgi:2-polyprenyl-6-methoxyphenol hydroxylase-like FAD-dependent oxidoreductase
MTVSVAKIGIIGGGIGGVAAAVAIHQVGIDAVVYERAPKLREAGVGMMLWPNATRVLRDLGLLEEVLLRSGPNTHFLVRARGGEVLMNIALGDFDVPAVCSRRADLLAVLIAALPSGCIRLGRELDHLEQVGDKVRIYFAGAGVEEGVEEHDAVIGADGIRSRVRSELFGMSDPIYRGYSVWRGMASYDGPAAMSGANSETWGAGHRFGILNTGHGMFTWYATANESSNHRDADCGRKRELQKMFARWHDPIPELIEATDEAAILKNGAYDLPPLRRWGDRLVTLLGDAAHPCTPNLGQGGGLALEDALVLAKCIARETSFAGALRRYESLRCQRTAHMQQRARLMGRIGQWENRVFVTARHAVTSVLPAKLFEHNLRRVYSYQT